MCIYMYVLFFFSFLADPQHMEFQGQGSDLSRSCNVHCYDGNGGSLTYCNRLVIEPGSQHSRDASNLAALQWELLKPNISYFLGRRFSKAKLSLNSSKIQSWTFLG